MNAFYNTLLRGNLAGLRKKINISLTFFNKLTRVRLDNKFLESWLGITKKPSY